MNKLNHLNKLIKTKAPQRGQIPKNIIKTLSNFWLDYLIELFEKAKTGEYIIIDINTIDNKTDYIYLTDTLILTGEKCYVWNITK